jgi:hypothetical protein
MDCCQEKSQFSFSSFEILRLDDDDLSSLACHVYAPHVIDGKIGVIFVTSNACA